MSIETPSQFLRAFFGAYSDAPVFLVSLPNTDEREGQAGPKEVLSRDPATIDGFVQRWDRKGRGLYFCVGTIKEGAMPNRPGGSRRNKENLAELVTAHAEVDAKEILCSLDEVIEAVWNLPHPPSITIRSGNGLHLYWLLSENLPADSESIYRLERLNEQLGELVGGDDVQDATRLLRVPFTHNTKKGAWKPVEIVEAKFEPRHEIDDLEEMVAMLSPVVKRKPPAPRADGGPAAADNPFLRVAAENGYTPPIDVRAVAESLARGAINRTTCSLALALSQKGVNEEEIVGYLMPHVERANRAHDGQYTERQARGDERRIRGQCRSARRNFPCKTGVSIDVALGLNIPRIELPTGQFDAGEVGSHRDVLAEVYTEETTNVVQLSAAQARTTQKDETVVGAAETVEAVANGANVVAFQPKTEKKRGRPEGSGGPKPSEVAALISDGVIEALRQDGRDMIHTEGDTFLYGEGVWCGAGPAEHQLLKVVVQRGCEALGHKGDARAANGALKLLLESPALYVPVVPWNTGDSVALGNGMLELRTRRFGSFSSKAWCRMKIKTPYEPRATCPIFLKFLESAFADREPDERAKIIVLLQEYFGSMLAVSTLHREQRKALLLFGPSRSGKTVLSSIARLLIGSRIASPSIADIGKDFGLQLLAAANAWVRDDAVSEGDRIDPARFKVLVTGEGLEINRKNQAPLTYSCNIPILLTTNVLPKAKDSSDALYNRCIVLDMRSVVDEEKSLEAKLALGIPAEAGVAEYIAEHEASGILNWALDGLDRLRERGRYDMPKSVKQTIEKFKASNNPVQEWFNACVEVDPEYMVSRADLRCAFHGYVKEEEGDGARAMGGAHFLKALEAFAYLGIDVEGKKDGRGIRMVMGLKLNDDGKRLWEDHKAKPLNSGCEGSSTSKDEINRACDARRTSEPKTEF
jgi:P4 family phage/plasmid primase-like protien